MIKIIYRFATQNYYGVLELNPACSQKQIKQNYLKLAKIFHPDVYKGQDHNRFKLIQEAYQTLKSAEKRAEYDRLNRKQDAPEQNTTEQQNTTEDDQKSEQFSSTSQFKFKHRDYEGIKDEQSVREEFKKFMDEPIKHQPEDIKIYENSLRRAMGKDLCQQHDNIFKRNNQKAYYVSYAHVLGYREQLSQYISSMNQQLKQKIESKEQIKKRTKDFYAKWGNVILITATLICGPILYSAMERRRDIQVDIEKHIEMVNKLTEEAQYLDVQSRFVY